MIRLTMLGTSGAAPTPERNTSAMSIKYNGSLYLFDCGEGCQRQMMKYNVGYGSVKAIFISHLHPDHYIGIMGLAYTLQMSGRTDNLYIYGPRGTIKLINCLFMDHPPEFLIVKEYDEGVIFRNNLFKITSFRVKHSTNSYGFIFEELPRLKFKEKLAKSIGIKGILFREIQEKGVITINGKTIRLEDVSWYEPGKKIVYSGDCVYDESLVNYYENADILIHDGTFTSDDGAIARDKFHSTVREAAMLAAKAKVKLLIITHISGRYDNPQNLESDAKPIFKNTIIGYDGMDIKI